MRQLVPDVEEILLKKVSDKEVANGENITKDITAGIMFIINLINNDGGAAALQISIPLMNIIDEEAMNRISMEKNITSPIFLPSLVFSPKPQLLTRVLNIPL